MPLALTACTEAELASHLVKSISGDAPKTIGYFKVGNPYKIKGRYYTPKESYNLVETGTASWYGPGFHGKMTANGETFNENELTAAHRTLQMPSIIRVTNLGNGRAVIMRVNDRGPFAHNRILDVSKRGAELLGFKNAGTAKVRVEVLEQESRHVAQLAKSGQSTHGTEIAANKNRRSVMPRNMDYAQKPLINTPSNPNQQYANQGTLQPADMTNAPPPLRSPATIEREALPAATTVRSNVAVQAGSFSSLGNATSFAKSLSRYGTADVSPIEVGGRTLYRVRIPAPSTKDAEMILSHLNSQGNSDAIIIVE